ncbi:alpha/beta hydrolase [Ideonella livida]|uniref:Alpha/beta hydrolase n=1 Tax=Ideonella livida TaxID=2707176 RepID=A0A7C9PKL1_9BURK|nr:alpha/beta hydrolase [Ideonella livida]NDY93611.1 alpha/beta hydrolase [Ideonella livida]
MPFLRSLIRRDHRGRWPWCGLAAGGVVALAGVAWAQPAVPGAVPALPVERAAIAAARPGVQLPLAVSPVPPSTPARAAVVLLPGAGGGWGRWTDTGPDGRNLLVRDRAAFWRAGLQVVLMGRASDSTDLDYPDRISPSHLADVRAVVDWVHVRWGLPVWLVGTSRGSISAAAAALSLPPGRLAGLVLSATVTRQPRHPQATVLALPLERLRLPVLLLHHQADACPVSPPQGVAEVVARLTAAEVVEPRWVQGGGPPQGGSCEAMHFHGLVGQGDAALNALALRMLALTPAP